MINRGRFYLLTSILAMMIILAYSNHFQGGFHFDDSHVIEQNINIRSIENIPRFFLDATTFSALPANQTYRPVLSTLFALEYRIGGGSPVWFHIIGFGFYLILWMLLYFFFRKVFAHADLGDGNEIAALIAASFYILHAANAETVNYVSAHSDLLSTMLMVASLLLYAARPKWRRLGLYLFPAALAMLTKEVSIVFPLLLLAYIFLEKKISLPDIFKSERRGDVLRSLSMALPSALVCLGLLVLSSLMLPKTYTPSSLSRLEYVLAQPFVIVHYFNSFLLLLNLSADTDWEPIRNLFDDRVPAGIGFIVLMTIAAVLASRKDRTRPICFGILWFFFGCLPTSSGVVPLAEVMNDHRMFLPFIGLAIAASWSLLLLMNAAHDDGFRSAPPILRINSYRGSFLRAALVLIVAGVLAGHAYGTFQRNKVWRNEESLWHDVTIKSPRNGRGLMNYGLTLMSKGDTRGALQYFEKALLITPGYAHLHINIAIARDALGETAAAESHFRRAMELNPNFHGCYYYYARFLHGHNRVAEAVPLLRQAIGLAPGFAESKYLLMRIYARQRDWYSLGETVDDALRRSSEDTLARSYREIVHSSVTDPVRAHELAALNDPSPENYIWLSLAYYQTRLFKKSIEASEMALKLRTNYAEAYNNICSAYVMLGEKSKAVEACESALAINPQFDLARNNLKQAQGL